MATGSSVYIREIFYYFYLNINRFIPRTSRIFNFGGSYCRDRNDSRDVTRLSNGLIKYECSSFSL
jgi:hypothetical protein